MERDPGAPLRGRWHRSAAIASLPEQADETDVVVDEPALDVGRALGRSIGGQEVVEEIGNFAPGDDLRLGRDRSGRQNARGAVDVRGRPGGRRARPIGGGLVSEFRLKPDGAGHYEVVILLNGQEADRKS
jgi:hypothetical protein